MEDVIALFYNYTFCVVALGSSLLGMIAGALGCFALLRKQSLLGDGIAHCALPGVVMVFLLTGQKNLGLLLTGGMISGMTGCVLILILTKYSKIKFDSALAMILSFFFGIGTVLLSLTQKIPNAKQAGLDRFIYGQAASMLKSDVTLIACAGVVILLSLLFFWKEFKLFTFDPEFAYTLGFPTEKINVFLTFLVILAILIGLQTVGVVLMSAMLVSPALAARQWVNRLDTMVFLATFIGGMGGLSGTMASSLYSNMPTGAVIVVILSVIVLFSLLFGTNQGIIQRIYRRKSQDFTGREEEMPCQPVQKSK